MSTIFSFTVPGVATAKGRGRATVTKAGHVRVYTPEKTRAAEETFVARSLAFRPRTPLSGPIRLVLKFVMPCPKSAPRSLKDRLGVQPPHTKRPDLDNLEKLVKDACNGVFWIDDAQVFEVSKTKVYGIIPQIEVWIEEMEMTP